MQKVFFPAIVLTNRMSYTRKFMLLWLLSLVAIVVIAYSLFVSLNRVIYPSQQQLQGLVLVGHISKTVRLVQQHRGFSSALLGGDELMRGRRAAKEKEADEAFNAMERKLPSTLASSEDWRNIKTKWERLRKDGLDWTMDESLAAHTGLIKQMRLFHAVAADEYMLNMDSEVGTYYLIDTIVTKLPDAIEHFGQIRGYSTGILAKKQITEQQKIKLNSIIAELDSAIEDLTINIEKTGRYNSAIRGAVSAASKDITGSVRQITDLVASDIFAGRFATPSDIFLNIATVAIDKSYAEMHEVLIPAAESLIKARISRAKNLLYINICVVSFLFLLVVYFSVGIYYSIIGNIQSLASSARAFANGELDKRIKLNTHDELKWIGDIFNEMADGFSTLLESHRKSEKALSDLSAHLQTVREEEKANLAREIHDDLGGTLAAIKMDFYCLVNDLPENKKEPLLNRVESISKLLDNSVNTTRNIITNLRPTILDDLGILAAIEWQVAQFHKRTGIKCRINCVEDKGGLDKQRSIALFRIFQEALTNISRHSGASRVEVEFHHGDDDVTLSVSDNGCGMMEQHAIAQNSYGIRGMIERAEQLGGKVRFDSPPGGGFGIMVTLPLPANNQKERKA